MATSITLYGYFCKTVFTISVNKIFDEENAAERFIEDDDEPNDKISKWGNYSRNATVHNELGNNGKRCWLSLLEIAERDHKAK